MPNATELKARIVKLEGNLAAQLETVAKAEKAVAAAFANDKDPAAPLTALANEKANAAGMIGALEFLDSQWYESAVLEFEAGLKAINDETDAAYREASEALIKAIDSGLVPVLRKYGIGEAYLGDFTENVKDGAWSVFSAKGADKLRALGTRPNKPFARDENGRLREPDKRVA
jgi:uncharacterized coiled-coil protein SlyX